MREGWRNGGSQGASTGHTQSFKRVWLVTQDEIAEMKRKFKIMNHQIEQLKEEIGQKDQAYIKEHIEHSKADKEKETLKNELMRVKKQARDAAEGKGRETGRRSGEGRGLERFFFSIGGFMTLFLRHLGEEAIFVDLDHIGGFTILLFRPLWGCQLCRLPKFNLVYPSLVSSLCARGLPESLLTIASFVRR
eukprot:5296959-Pleurochrysis_carterae.AAC.2